MDKEVCKKVVIRLTEAQHAALRRRAVWHDRIAGREAAEIVAGALARDERRGAAWTRREKE